MVVALRERGRRAGPTAAAPGPGRPRIRPTTGRSRRPEAYRRPPSPCRQGSPRPRPRGPIAPRSASMSATTPAGRREPGASTQVQSSRKDGHRTPPQVDTSATGRTGRRGLVALMLSALAVSARLSAGRRRPDRGMSAPRLHRSRMGRSPLRPGLDSPDSTASAPRVCHERRVRRCSNRPSQFQGLVNRTERRERVRHGHGVLRAGRAPLVAIAVIIGTTAALRPDRSHRPVRRPSAAPWRGSSSRPRPARSRPCPSPGRSRGCRARALRRP